MTFSIFPTSSGRLPQYLLSLGILDTYLPSSSYQISVIVNMSNETQFKATETQCSAKYYPTPGEFLDGLGGGAIALYVTSSAVVAVLLVEFLILVKHFFKHVPGRRRVATLWVNSVYLVVALATLFNVALPNSTDFVWLFYRVYLSMAMGYFVDLTLAWYGGESEMLRHVGEGRLVNFRIRPCCCCIFCCGPRSGVAFTRDKIKLLRGAVYQVNHSFGLLNRSNNIFITFVEDDNGSLFRCLTFNPLLYF